MTGDLLEQLNTAESPGEQRSNVASQLTKHPWLTCSRLARLSWWQLGATMFTLFGLLALIVAAVGLYSAIAYNVAQRRRELGVRIALGARTADVLRLVMGEGLRVSAVAVVLGTALALLAGRWVKPLLYEVSERDPVTLGVVTVTLLVVAAVASFIPARRAARVDPSVSFRAD